jgi:hypothetical protein
MKYLYLDYRASSRVNQLFYVEILSRHVAKAVRLGLSKYMVEIADEKQEHHKENQKKKKKKKKVKRKREESGEKA